MAAAVFWVLAAGHRRQRLPPRAAAGCRRQHKKAAWPPEKRPRSGENCCGSNRKVPPKAAKGFNFVSAKPPLRRAESRFAEPRCSLQRERIYSFRLYEKNQKYPRGLRTSGLRGRFKALSKKILAKLSSGTSRNRFFAQNGGEKALNRCDVPALQREDLERRLKEQLYSFVDSRLWLGKKGRRAKKNSLFNLCKADQ